MKRVPMYVPTSVVAVHDGGANETMPPTLWFALTRLPLPSTASPFEPASGIATLHGPVGGDS